jgi:galactose mutarotase-like enzyme
MYTIQEYNDQFKMYELREESTNSWIKVCPERGAIITSLGVKGEEIFYLDKDTFYDINTNIRGGNPILFPICGQLVDGKYELGGKTYKMRNHGVARNNAWEVVETNTDGKASITLSLKSNEATKKEFPFDFELLFTYVLEDGKLLIEQAYMNDSDEAMPMYAGFHPYFAAASKDIAYETDATEYLDHNDLVIKPYTGRLDLTNMVESAMFNNAKKHQVSFELPGMNRKIKLEYGEVFDYVVVWSVKDKPFVCVEPWMGKNEAFNSGDGLVLVKPHECLNTHFDISLV